MSRLRRILAAVACAQLALAGLVGTVWADVATAASNGPKLSATLAPREGGTITVNGTGFSPAFPGVYVAIVPASATGFYQHFGGERRDAEGVYWVSPNAGRPMPPIMPLQQDGTFEVTFEVPAFEEGSGYAIVTSKAHGHGKTDPSQDARVEVEYEPLTSDAEDSIPTVPDEDAQPTPEPATPTPEVETNPDASTETEPETPTTETEQPGEAVEPSPSAPSDVPEEVAPEPTPAPSEIAPESNQSAAPTASSPTQPLAEPKKKECEVDPAFTRVVSGSLDWGIRSSFVNYVRGAIAKGSMHPSGGVSWNGSTLVWSAGRGTYNTKDRTGTINYAGSVHFTGHRGALDLTISNPSLWISGNSAALYANVSSSNMAGEKQEFGRVHLANVTLTNVSASNTTLSFDSSTVNLTAVGAEAFAGFYSVGEPMNLLSSSLRLAPATSCDPVTGELIVHEDVQALPNTGADIETLALLATLTILSGLAMVTVRRVSSNH